MTGLIKLTDEFWKTTCLDAIWRMSGVILATRDDSGIILAVNDAAARMFGYDGVLNSMQGMCVDDLVDPAKKEAHTGHRKGFNKYPQTRMMGERTGLVARKRDGSTFVAHISLYPIDVPVTADKKEKLVLLMIV